MFSLSVGHGPFVETLPTSGKVGVAIEILGPDLTSATSVIFNGAAASFKVESDTLISAIVPAGATSGFVAVTLPRGTLRSNAIFRVWFAASGWNYGMSHRADSSRDTRYVRLKPVLKTRGSLRESFKRPQVTSFEDRVAVFRFVTSDVNGLGPVGHGMILARCWRRTERREGGWRPLRSNASPPFDPRTVRTK